MYIPRSACKNSCPSQAKLSKLCDLAGYVHVEVVAVEKTMNHFFESDIRWRLLAEILKIKKIFGLVTT